MELILKLILAHVLGDFLFQPYKWVQDKEKNKVKSPFLYWHIFVHFIILLVLLQFDFKYWIGLLIIIVFHYLIDLAKVNLIGKINRTILFIIDQVLHFSIITGVIYIYTPFTIEVSDIFSKRILLIILALILVTTVSSTIIKIIISRWNLKDLIPDSSLKNAGLIIGMLERLFVFAFVVTHHWEGIGFLLAAKSVFRFGDLSKAEDRQLTEYILIGTLLSFGLAILIGILYTNFEKLI